MTRAWVSVAADGRIGATTDDERFAEGMEPFEFPDGFDFSRQADYRIVDGALVNDGAQTEADTAAQTEADAAAQALTELPGLVAELGEQVTSLQLALADLYEGGGTDG